jgi:hypothetical protein
MKSTLLILLSLLFSYLILAANTKTQDHDYTWFGKWKVTESFYLKLEKKQSEHIIFTSLLVPDSVSNFPCHRITINISDLNESGFLSHSYGFTRQETIQVINEDLITFNGDSLERIDEFPFVLADCYSDKPNRPEPVID